MRMMAEVLIPIFLCIGLGALARRRGWLEAGFWVGAERLCYFALLPALLVASLAKTDLSGVPADRLAGAVVGTMLAGAAATVLLRPLARTDGPGFTSVFQGAIRFNNFTAFSLILALHGAGGAAVSAVVAGMIVPTANVLCVLAFAFCAGRRPSALGVLRQLAVNPLILACVVGLLANLAGGLPGWGISAAVEALGRAGLALGLLAVGAGLSAEGLAAKLRPLGLATALKLLAMPAIALALGWTFALEPALAAIVALVMAQPTATSAYVLARQLGGDAPLMAAITTVQTLAAAATLPLWIVLVS